MFGIPGKGIGVEISSWVEPEVKLLLSFTLPLSIYISVDCVRIPAEVPQELKVYLITGWPW